MTESLLVSHIMQKYIASSHTVIIVSVLICQVGGRTINAHRAVVACASVYMFELFSSQDGTSTPRAYYELDVPDYDSLEILVNYAYTSLWVWWTRMLMINFQGWHSTVEAALNEVLISVPCEQLTLTNYSCIFVDNNFSPHWKCFQFWVRWSKLHWLDPWS